jgi:hypothetical protein
LLAIIAADGAVVHRISDCNGRRRLVKGIRGGLRIRKCQDRTPWLHADAKAGLAQLVDIA